MTESNNDPVLQKSHIDCHGNMRQIFCRTQRQKLDNSESGPISRKVPIYETVYNSLSYKYIHEDMNTVISSISKDSCTV